MRMTSADITNYFLRWISMFTSDFEQTCRHILIGESDRRFGCVPFSRGSLAAFSKACCVSNLNTLHISENTLFVIFSSKLPSRYLCSIHLPSIFLFSAKWFVSYSLITHSVFSCHFTSTNWKQNVFVDAKLYVNMDRGGNSNCEQFQHGVTNNGCWCL